MRATAAGVAVSLVVLALAANITGDRGHAVALAIAGVAAAACCRFLDRRRGAR